MPFPVSSVDLERVRWLRSIDYSIKEPESFKSIPGLLRARKPNLFVEITRSQEIIFDY
tara:strand:+ start:3137 stop:3310 length:174 start_codon:yes stop_codon:yes gene_type:complete